MKLHQRIRREQARHTDDWLITYADTITLLLCLFVVMLSIKSGLNLARDRAAPVQPAASEDLFTRIPPTQEQACAVAAADEAVKESPPETVRPAAAALDVAFVAPFVETPPEIVAAVPEPETSPRSDLADTAPTIGPAEIPEADTPEPSADSLPAIAARLKSGGTEAAAQQGDRITTMEISSAAFFGSGYAALSGAGKSILRDVAVTLKSDGYAAYNISIEGHTDDSPISTAQFQSNWELSTARAAAVVRFFLEQGIPARKLTAAGYADTFPIVPNRKADGSVIPENQARNRRVVIKLEKIDRADR